MDMIGVGANLEEARKPAILERKNTQSRFPCLQFNPADELLGPS